MYVLSQSKTQQEENMDGSAFAPKKTVVTIAEHPLLLRGTNYQIGWPMPNEQFLGKRKPEVGQWALMSPETDKKGCTSLQLVRELTVAELNRLADVQAQYSLVIRKMYCQHGPYDWGLAYAIPNPILMPRPVMDMTVDPGAVDRVGV